MGRPSARLRNNSEKIKIENFESEWKFQKYRKRLKITGQNAKL